MFAVIGAGSWGSALAIHLGQCGHTVKMWGRDLSPGVRENESYLPGIPFPDTLSVVKSIEEAMEEAEYVMIAVPSFVFRDILEEIKPLWKNAQRLFWVTKGFDKDTSRLLIDVCAEVMGESVVPAILSGPSFAKEVAAGLPTAVILASHDEVYAKRLAACFSHDRFRAYTSKDVVGVQVGGAVKNVLAIATGISDGMGFGANARCALITRGLAELSRLGYCLGGSKETFMGLSGMGDLILTCTDDQSRNRRFGLALGEGLSIQEALDKVVQVVEGVETVKHVKALAEKFNLDMPIVEEIYAITQEGRSSQLAMERLFSRELKAE